MQTTRDKIILHALLLFSQKGYQAVSVQEIAQAVGIRAPSLYNHFDSKRAIFDTIIYDMTATYHKQAAQVGLSWQNGCQDAKVFDGIAEEQLLTMVDSLFSWFLHEPTVSSLRRMLTLSQYENQHLADLLTKLYQTDPLNYLRQLFGVMFKGSTHTPETLAMVFYAPLYLLLIRCDREPAFEPQAREDLAAHLHHFVKTYVPAPET